MGSPWHHPGIILGSPSNLPPITTTRSSARQFSIFVEHPISTDFTPIFGLYFVDDLKLKISSTLLQSAHCTMAVLNVLLQKFYFRSSLLQKFYCNPSRSESVVCKRCDGLLRTALINRACHSLLLYATRSSGIFDVQARFYERDASIELCAPIQYH